MRRPKPWDSGPGDRSAYADVLLAMTLARYDREIARSLIEPLVRGDDRSRPYFNTRRAELPAAVAAIDPKWAVELVEAMPDDPDLKIQSTKNAARLAVANLLGRAGEKRFRHIESSYLNLWVPDTEDHDPIN